MVETCLRKKPFEKCRRKLIMCFFWCFISLKIKHRLLRFGFTVNIDVVSACVLKHLDAGLMQFVTFRWFGSYRRCSFIGLPGYMNNTADTCEG